MKLLVLDFETYWDRTDYTLSKMPTEEYVRDPRFKAHGVGLQMGNGEPVYVQEGQIGAIFNKIDWSDTAVLCQNTAFDGFILEERYGIQPKMYLDTMSMFRFLYPNRRASLANICKTFGLPDKGNEVSNTSGIRDLSPAQQRRLGEYCKDDVRFTRAAFDIMKGSVPAKELKIIDLTIRWAVRAVLRLNTGLLQEALAEEIEAKRLLLEKIESDKTTLSSALLFAELLRSMGITPPIKISPTALKKDKGLADMADSIRQEDGLLTITACETAGIPWTYAFGKADKEFKILAEHDDPMISAVIQARLGVKSTLKETRTERLIKISERGALPVPLFFYGAAPGRWSATGKINLQNMPRHTGENRSKLRDAIEAPEGYSIVVRDLANIEARVLAFVAGQEDLTQIFRNNGDVYSAMATEIYQRPITKKDKIERQLGKTIVLGSGYGMSWKKFTDYCPVKFTQEDLVNFPEVSVEWFLQRPVNLNFTKNNRPSNIELKDYQAHCAICNYLINVYREKNDRIVSLWREVDSSLVDIHQKRERQIGAVPGLVTTCAEGFRLPEGRYIRYFDMEVRNVGQRLAWSRMTRDGRSGLYGGLCVENIVQGLARHIMADQLLELEAMGFRSVFTCHDEIVFCVPDAQARECLEASEYVMNKAPAWIEGLPLGSEGSISKTYGGAK